MCFINYELGMDHGGFAIHMGHGLESRDWLPVEGPMIIVKA